MAMHPSECGSDSDWRTTQKMGKSALFARILVINDSCSAAGTV